jgi:hypothetical protein
MYYGNERVVSRCRQKTSWLGYAVLQCICMYYVCTYVLIYVYLRMYMCVCMYIRKCFCVCMYTHVCMYVRTYVHIYIFTYVMCVRMYAACTGTVLIRTERCGCVVTTMFCCLRFFSPTKDSVFLSVLVSYLVFSRNPHVSAGTSNQNRKRFLLYRFQFIVSPVRAV